MLNPYTGIQQGGMENIIYKCLPVKNCKVTQVHRWKFNCNGKLYFFLSSSLEINGYIPYITTTMT